MLQALGARSLVDAACGDFHWMRSVDLRGVDYAGVDIVSEIVQANRCRYAGQNRWFVRADIVSDVLPKGDVVLCRDCLVHLPYPDIFAALANFEGAGFRYLIATTFTELAENADIPVGGWRPLNLQAAPFYFPEPLEVIRENNPAAR